MSDSEQTSIPEKLPLLWRLMFWLFAAGGTISALGILGEQSSLAAVEGMISAAVLLAAGVLGLKRHRVGLYLSVLILVGSAVQLDIPLLFEHDYVAIEVQRTYDEINAITATTLSPDPELVSQIEMLYRGIAVAITALHLWMSLYLWRRRHWFTGGDKSVF